MEEKTERKSEKKTERKTGSRKKSGGRKRDWRFLAGCVAMTVVFGVMVGLFLNGVFAFLDRAETEGAETLRSAIRRSCVQCYAIEGRYPPGVDYLEEEYGIQIDRDRYNVFYDGFASNIMPEITVIPVPAEGGETDVR